MVECAALYCSVLHCVTVCNSASQLVAVCCSAAAHPSPTPSHTTAIAATAATESHTAATESHSANKADKQAAPCLRFHEPRPAVAGGTVGDMRAGIASEKHTQRGSFLPPPLPTHSFPSRHPPYNGQTPRRRRHITKTPRHTQQRPTHSPQKRRTNSQKRPRVSQKRPWKHGGGTHTYTHAYTHTRTLARRTQTQRRASAHHRGAP